MNDNPKWVCICIENLMAQPIYFHFLKYFVSYYYFTRNMHTVMWYITWEISPKMQRVTYESLLITEYAIRLFQIVFSFYFFILVVVVVGWHITIKTVAFRCLRFFVDLLCLNLLLNIKIFGLVESDFNFYSGRDFVIFCGVMNIILCVCMCEYDENEFQNSQLTMIYWINFHAQLSFHNDL